MHLMYPYVSLFALLSLYYVFYITVSLHIGLVLHKNIQKVPSPPVGFPPHPHNLSEKRCAEDGKRMDFPSLVTNIKLSRYYNYEGIGKGITFTTRRMSLR
ncbi:hypothetical protein FKM82_030970 [Ascaphus truei]